MSAVICSPIGSAAHRSSAASRRTAQLEADVVVW
jgi:hypothetical protein